MRLTSHWRPIGLAVLIAVVAGSGFNRAVAAPFENAVPQDCILFVNVANAKSLKEKLEGTDLARLYKDPQMQPFVNGIKTELAKTLAAVEEEVSIDFKRLLSTPQGQMAVAAGVKGNIKNFYVLFLADVSGKEDVANETLNLVSQKLEQEGLTKQSKGNLTVYRLDKNEPVELAFTVQENVLAIGINSEVLQETLARLDGASGSLGSSDAYRGFRNKAGGTGDLEFFVNLRRIFDQVTQIPQAQPFVDAFGADKFEYAGVNISIGKDDFEFVSRSMIVTNGPSQIFQLLNMPAKPTSPQAWVPQNVASYSSFHWDLDKFYSTLGEILDRFLPGALQQAEFMVSQFPSPDNPFITSIKGDIIGPLGNRLTTVGDLGESRGLPVSRTLIAWELDDAEKLNNLVGNLMVLFGQLLETKTVKGATVYSYDVGSLLALQMQDQNAPVPVGVVAFTIANSQLYLTTHIELLDTVLNFSGAGLAESAEYRRIASKFPANTSSISFVRSEAQGRAFWQMLKSGQLSKMLRGAAEQQDEDADARLIEGWATALDGSNLPDFEQVKQHFTTSGGFSVMDQNGLQTTYYTLK